ncbi:MAG: hypothetical protein KDK28_13090 [Maritimibacter sp.]|nr:hypothetical protein [Maritimibacter sp.]
MAANHHANLQPAGTTDRTSNGHDGVLIAETGETGEVTWVWVLKTGERIPRPFRRRDVGLALHRYTPAGVDHAQIASWVGTAARG